MPAYLIEAPTGRTFDTKVQPADFQQFKSEFMSKYPTWNPPNVDVPFPEISLDQVAAASIPEPLKPLFPSYHDLQHEHHLEAEHEHQQQQRHPQAHQQYQQPATPAPSPPQSPQMKPKKQQFQTDQHRPFVMPYTSQQSRQPMMVPRAIAEAGDLYAQHVRISTELWQTVKLREEMIADESGTSQAEADQLIEQSSTLHGLEGRMASLKLTGRDRGSAIEDDEQDLADPLDMLQSLEQDLKREAKGKGKAGMERIEDVRRLQRIELFYVGELLFVFQCRSLSGSAAVDPPRDAKRRHRLAQVAACYGLTE